MLKGDWVFRVCLPTESTKYIYIRVYILFPFSILSTSIPKRWIHREFRIAQQSFPMSKVMCLMSASITQSRASALQTNNATPANQQPANARNVENRGKQKVDCAAPDKMYSLISISKVVCLVCLKKRYKRGGRWKGGWVWFGINHKCVAGGRAVVRKRLMDTFRLRGSMREAGRDWWNTLRKIFQIEKLHNSQSITNHSLFKGLE